MTIPPEEGTRIRMQINQYIISCGIVYVIVILNQSNLMAKPVGLVTVAATVLT